MIRNKSWAAAGLILLLGSAPGAAAAQDLSARARSDATLPSLFSDRDYPPAAIRNREQGAVTFRLTIGPDGRPAACEATASSGSQLLDSTTCRLLMERARFQPARDSKGKAVADAVSGRIVWRLPDSGEMDRSEAAMMLWGVCVTGEAAKLALSDLPAAEMVRKSYEPCKALENLAAAEIGAPFEARRGEIGQALQELVFKARSVLRTPRPVPTPRRP